MNLQPGPVREDCVCGCGKYSIVRKNGHVRGCPCRKCLGGRNRESGLKKQRQARKRAGVPLGKYWGQLGNEEQWGGAWRIEVKSGVQVKPIGTRFLAAEMQSYVAKAEGDSRPFALIAMPPRMGSEGLVVVRLSDWEKYVAGG